jgi:glycosyltransferase involved in cell wall biosynthesis
MRRLLVLEPYYGGSHRAVLDVLLPALGWEFDLLTLPARKWKWRMRGSAITFSQRVRELSRLWRDAHPSGEAVRPSAHGRWDAVLVSTFVNFAELKGLTGDALAGVPAALYFHENQLVYPNRHAAEWDLQFPLTNVTSALAADACWFNTQWNLDAFVSGIDPFLRQFPDHRPRGLADTVRVKSAVLYPPFDPAVFDRAAVRRGARCRIVWPHRWEHDKDPETFFRVVTGLAEEGLDFEVAVAGQAFVESTADFEVAAGGLGDRLVHLGQPDGRDEYAALLAGSDVSVSTAVNEFFGLAMIESAYAGCLPLVPDRLAYPELYPAPMRYGSSEELASRLRELVTSRPAPGQGRALAERFTIDALIPAYRGAFEALVARTGR